METTLVKVENNKTFSQTTLMVVFKSEDLQKSLENLTKFVALSSECSNIIEKAIKTSNHAEIMSRLRGSFGDNKHPLNDIYSLDDRLHFECVVEELEDHINNTEGLCVLDSWEDSGEAQIFKMGDFFCTMEQAKVESPVNNDHNQIFLTIKTREFTSLQDLISDFTELGTKLGMEFSDIYTK